MRPEVYARSGSLRQARLRALGRVVHNARICHLGFAGSRRWEPLTDIHGCTARWGPGDDPDVGDVAWAEGHGRFTRAGGGERPARMTWVLIRESGQWKVVQSHASIGVLGADTFV